MFKGTYVFKENGKEIGRSSNLITTNGRKVLLQYLAGIKSTWASNLAIGAITTPPTINDTQLNFETGRYPITLRTYQAATVSTPDLIIVRATLPALMYANIYEVGVYPEDSLSNISNRSNNIIVDFSDLTNWTTTAGSTYISGFTPGLNSSPRIGGYSVELAPNTTVYNNTYSIDLSNYDESDNLQILAYNTTAGALSVKMTNSSGYSAIFNYSLSSNSEYQVLSVPFPSTIYDSNSSVVASPPRFLNTINSVTITTDSTASGTIDVIKTSSASKLTNNDFIISKSVLSTPIAKTYGVPLDVEYYIELL